MQQKTPKSPRQIFYNVLGMGIGAFLAAFSIQVFLFPNRLIDGGIIGISLIFARYTSSSLLPLYLILLNIPFVYLAYRHIRRSFVIQMLIALSLFAGFLAALEGLHPFDADVIEVIALGGAILGAGAGLIIRFGGCTDGTEILAIIVNRKKGFTVGQVVFFINFFIFVAYGLISLDWHIAIRSLLTYLVAYRVMDIVIAGLEEMKSVLIMSSQPAKISKMITHEMGLGLTEIKGKGGFTGEERNILLVIVERLDLADLKEFVLQEDPNAFIAIENLHEVAYGRQKNLLAKRRGHKAKRRA